MNVTRGTTLAALVLAALAAPVTAFALSATDHPAPPRAVAAHTDETGSDDVESDEPSDSPDPESTPGNDQAAAASAPGRAHAAAMQVWAHCVAEAASGPKTQGQPMPPKTACGDKPVGPGLAKHLSSAATGKSGGRGPGTHGPGPHGKASGHRP